MENSVMSHWGIIAAIIGTHWFHLAINSAINTMPPKGSKLSWGTLYGWFYDAVRLYLSVKPNPTPPADPAKP